jgi:hypothetical protein
MMAAQDSTGSIEQSTPLESYDGLAWARMMVEQRILKAKTRDARDVLYSVLILLERGDVEVYLDPMTGELLYKAKELN